ncbi:MAG: nucleotidyltransferase domain-containing protein [Saprospiraceae bacterium]
MVTRTNALNQIAELLEALSGLGYRPTRACLFGSVATGRQHECSDIDLALWDERFSGCLTIDYEPIKHILTRFPLIELHTFAASDDESTHPWAKEIIKKGLPIDLGDLPLRASALNR